MNEVVFWQQIASPHMLGLARALAASGAHVSYVARARISPDRARDGWEMPDSGDVQLVFVADGAQAATLARETSPMALHLVEGVRRNGYIRHVISVLSGANARWGVLMETVDDRLPLGPLKRLDYALSFQRTRPEFVLAAGARTPAWVAARGMSDARVFPFAYFLDEHSVEPPGPGADGSFTVGFCGRLCPSKRLDLLLAAMHQLETRDLRLVVIGQGPRADELQRSAIQKLGPDRLDWRGALPMAEARRAIATLDCLVLPSDYDGWGAVVSEALLAGVPAICSDACGSAVAVRASGVGGVFPAGNAEALRALLARTIEMGRPDHAERRRVARWAHCLSSEAGAGYLAGITAALYDGAPRPPAPWEER